MLLGVRARSGIAQAAALVTGLTALSAVLGFLRDVVIAGVFGAGAQLDAFLVAQGLMNLVLAMIAGAMAKATVPVWTCTPMNPESGSSLFVRPRNVSLGSAGSAVKIVAGSPFSFTE